MGMPKRKIKTFHPRKSSIVKHLEMQKIADLEHRINMQMGTFLVLLEEGTPEQIDLAKQKAKAELIKFGPEMQKLAHELAGKLPKAVDEFLDSVDAIVHSSSKLIDEALISTYSKTSQNLEKIIQLKEEAA